MLHIMLALDRITDVVEFFKIDQSLQPIPFGEAFHEPRPMLKQPADEVIRHANVQYAIRSIGQNVNVAACHAEILQDVDGRDKPGHDELRELY
jgi:hypothetical protein